MSLFYGIRSGVGIIAVAAGNSIIVIIIVLEVFVGAVNGYLIRILVAQAAEGEL
jgi:hypothetical protein